MGRRSLDQHRLTSYNTTAPNNGVPLTITVDGSTFSFTGDGTPAGQTTNPSYTVSFSGNGGSGNMAAETANAATPLTSDGFTRPGYTFTGWNTAANGSGTAYADGSTYAFTANATLYAQWKADYTVTFSANGGAGAMAAETSDAPAALTADGFARTGYTFTGWNTAANGKGTAYADGASYPFAANVTLYAQWKLNPARDGLLQRQRRQRQHGRRNHEFANRADARRLHADRLHVHGLEHCVQRQRDRLRRRSDLPLHRRRHAVRTVEGQLHGLVQRQRRRGRYGRGNERCSGRADR